jgi:hypothetical protein
MSDNDDDGEDAHGGRDCVAGWMEWRCSSSGGAHREGGLADGECERALWWTAAGGWDVDEREARGGRRFTGHKWS